MRWFDRASLRFWAAVRGAEEGFSAESRPVLELVLGSPVPLGVVRDVRELQGRDGDQVPCVPVE